MHTTETNDNRLFTQVGDGGGTPKLPEPANFLYPLESSGFPTTTRLPDCTPLNSNKLRPVT